MTAIQNGSQAFSENNAAVQQQMVANFPDPVERETMRQQIVSNLETAYEQASTAQTDPRWFVPRGPLVGIVQAAMDTRESISDVALPGGLHFLMAHPAVAEAPLEKFGPLDPGWIECLIDGFVTLIRGKAPFVQHKSLSDFLYTVPDRLTIALVSDWGANNEAAARVATQIRAADPDMLIHLGDIYYAGQQNEANDMLNLWPLNEADGSVTPGKSFALNGNHEMFTGGHSYFGTVLPRFGQAASYFGLRNSNWQILAFDSAYVEQRLLPPAEAAKTDARLISQWNWLLDKMRNSTLPTILLDHHQPLSAYEQDNQEAANLRSDFQQFQTAAGRGIFGWFFGHEHRCTIYDDANIPYFARLIGHGSIPHSAPSAYQKPDPGCFSFAAMNLKSNEKGDAVSGFALLKFDGPSIDIRYINEDGSQFYEEIWDAPPPVS